MCSRKLEKLTHRMTLRNGLIQDRWIYLSSDLEWTKTEKQCKLLNGDVFVLLKFA